MMAAAHMPARRLSQLLAGLAEVAPADDIEIAGLAIDSREVERGDLFLACAGATTHGAEHIDDVLAAGAAAIAWEPDTRFPAHRPPRAKGGVPLLAVSRLGQQVGVIADRFYAQPSKAMTVVGITGTDGKTSCSHFIAQAVQALGRRCGVIGTLGYGLYGDLQPATHTTPDALRVHSLMHAMREQGAEWCVMEVSSHALEQGRVNGVHFNSAVLTNITRDHLDYHGDLAAYAAAKRRLFDMPGLAAAVINLDDDGSRKMLRHLDTAMQRIGYSLAQGPASDRIVADELRLSLDGFTMRILSPWGNATLRSTLLGRFNAGNLLAVIAVLCQAGEDFDAVIDAVAGVQTVPGRMEPVARPGLPLFVIDYAHTPGALAQVLRSLRGHLPDGGRLICVFGCGGDRDRGKRPVMGETASLLADVVILTSDNPRSEEPRSIIDDIEAGIVPGREVETVIDRGEAISRAAQIASPNDIVLVAGKGHEQVQIVGENSIPFNDREQIERLPGGAA